MVGWYGDKICYCSSLGTIFLWVFWPSFNGALVTGDARYRAFVNTYFSLSGSVLMSFVISMFVDPKRKLDMVIVEVSYYTIL